MWTQFYKFIEIFRICFRWLKTRRICCNKYNSIFCISALYIFSDQELSKAFENFYKILENNGILIIDHGGTEDNLISFFFHEIFLFFEAYVVYYLSKIFNKKIGFKFDHNFGYRRKNKEIIKLANKYGFELVHVTSYDYLTELNRSIFIRKIIFISRYPTISFTALIIYC